ncbi:MAG: hypothetical protein BroJett003_15530 [Planctomycetota bacterium]|nr:MAG: hypothetical protein BroJett003_15530 [Planctomycetota bacterium]
MFIVRGGDIRGAPVVRADSDVPASDQRAESPDRFVEALHEGGDEEVGGEDGDEADDEGFGAGAADAFGAGSAGEALVAGDQSDGAAENDALDESGGDVFLEVERTCRRSLAD